MIHNNIKELKSQFTYGADNRTHGDKIFSRLPLTFGSYTSLDEFNPWVFTHHDQLDIIRTLNSDWWKIIFRIWSQDSKIKFSLLRFDNFFISKNEVLQKCAATKVLHKIPPISWKQPIVCPHPFCCNVLHSTGFSRWQHCPYDIESVNHSNKTQIFAFKETINVLTCLSEYHFIKHSYLFNTCKRIDVIESPSGMIWMDDSQRVLWDIKPMGPVAP